MQELQVLLLAESVKLSRLSSAYWATDVHKVQYSTCSYFCDGTHTGVCVYEYLYLFGMYGVCGCNFNWGAFNHGYEFCWALVFIGKLPATEGYG